MHMELYNTMKRSPTIFKRNPIAYLVHHAVFFSLACIEASCKVPHCAVPSQFLTVQKKVGSNLKLLSSRYHICIERLYIECSSGVGISNYTLLYILTSGLLSEWQREFKKETTVVRCL